MKQGPSETRSLRKSKNSSHSWNLRATTVIKTLMPPGCIGMYHCSLSPYLICTFRTIAQAVSRRQRTVKTRVRARHSTVAPDLLMLPYG